MDYKQQYNEMKQKYLDLKNKLLNSTQIGGHNRLHAEGTYKMNGHLYTVYRTEDNQMFSFRLVNPRDIDFKRDTTNDTRKPNKDKIMYINDRDTFDWFTFKYGMYDKYHMYIAWDRVANDYKGFYLNRKNKSLYLDRYEIARKGSQGKFRMKSWWAHEYEKMPSSIWMFEN